jgi:uncharacterized caspase-like protein
MPFLYRIMAMVFVLAPIFVAPASAQAPERRFALVIGNSEYKAGRLPTAANDAGLIAETLRTAGFDVAGARDLDQDTLRRSIREFLDKVSAAGPEAVSFIYLAGYGLQFEGENYMVPIDATIARDEDIPIEAIRISDFLRPLAGSPGGVKLVVIDAARQHPYTPTGPQLASGLALADPDPGMLVAFNTAPGSVAPIENGPYGAFAQALAEMIGTGGLGLDDVFARLRLRVNETTGGVAVPWYASKIAQPFLLTEATPDAPPPPQQVASTLALQSQPIQQFRDDQEAYMAALERDTIAGYEEFIAAFPNSPHVRRFRALIAVRREAIMWRRVLSINTREAYWSYLERYPQGAHAADCERRLTRLAAEWDPPQGFVPMAFADVAPPPPDEVVYLTQPEIVFNDPVFVAPPPVPVFFCPPRPREFVALVRAPPPPPVGAFFLPAPTVTFFSGPRPWVRPPVFVAPPPRPVIQQITINNTTIINQRPGGAAPMSPALPGTVVARINTGALRAPPPAPPVVPSLHNASLQHPGVSVLGTQVALPPRVHAATAPGTHVPTIPGAHPTVPNTAVTTPGLPPRPGLPGGAHAPVPNTAATTPGVPLGPGAPGGARPPVPNTAVTTPGVPPGPGLPGGARPPVPNTAVTTPGVPPGPGLPGGTRPPTPATATTTPGIPPVPGLPGGAHPSAPTTATTTPGGAHPPGGPGPALAPGGTPPHVAAPSPPAHVAPPPPPAPHVAAPSPPAHVAPPPPPAPHVAAPPPPAHMAPPPPPVPHVAAPPPAHVAPPPPPPAMHAAPPPPPPRAAPPPPVAHAPPAAAGGRRCVVENGREVCR